MRTVSVESCAAIIAGRADSQPERIVLLQLDTKPKSRPSASSHIGVGLNPRPETFHSVTVRERPLACSVSVRIFSIDASPDGNNGIRWLGAAMSACGSAAVGGPSTST